MGDDYAKPIVMWIGKPAGGPPVTVKPDWTSGQTPNHCEELLAAWAGQNLPSARDLILDWYGPNLKLIGDQAKGGTDEALFSKSHWGHFGAARGPILLFSMRSGDQPVTDLLVSNWKGNLAAARLVALPSWSTLVVAGSRFSDDSDQRMEAATTFAWLDHGADPKPTGVEHSSIRMPKTMFNAPSWLGLYALTLIAAAWQKGEKWAAAWPEILQEIRSATETDLLPLKNPLTVERSAKGHVTRFASVDKMMQPALWSCAVYQGEQVSYGVPEGTPPPGQKGLVVSTSGAPACPGGPGKITHFPVAGQSGNRANH